MLRMPATPIRTRPSAGTLTVSSQERNSGGRPFTSITWKKNPCMWNGWSTCVSLTMSHTCSSPARTGSARWCDSRLITNSTPLPAPTGGTPVVSVLDRVAYLSRKALQNRGFEQKRAHPLGLPFEDLFGQKVEYVAVAAREGPDETRDVLAVPHRERSQLQASYPSLGALF